MSQNEIHYSRITELFGQAMELPADQWDDFFQENCSETEKKKELPKKVKQLLLAASGADNYFHNLGERIEGDLRKSFDDLILKPGQDFGKFKIIEQIGRGGMANVYLCERNDGQFEQKVAIKILNVKGNNEFLQKKFRQEQRILAKINHPNIATLFDGGITDDGFPYIIMEYIEGESIDDYCEKHQLTAKERIKLFTQVCDALQHAHNGLVVHHDIKPANILVNENGQVKLLDFGISYILFEQEKEKRQQYRYTGTVSYSSPEQLEGIAPTIASDIYSLGVVLLKLITGEPYHDNIPETQSQREFRDHFLQQKKLRTCRLLQKESNLFVSDISALLSKALNKDPQQRFSSVSAFLHDIKNLLANQPLHAHPTGFVYKMQKAYLRNKPKVWIFIFFNIALLITIGFFINQYFETLREKRRSEQILEFVWDVFDSADPESAKGDTIHAYDLLNNSVVRIDNLNQQPFLQAELYNITGDLLSKMGFWERGGELQDQALKVLENQGNKGYSSVVYAKTLIDAAAYHRNMNNYDAADSLIDKSIEAFRKSRINKHKNYHNALRMKASILRSQEKYEESIEVFNESLQFLQSFFDDPEDEIFTLASIASVYRDLTDYDMAREYMDKAISLIDETPEIDKSFNRIVSITYNNMAILLGDVGELENANTYLEKSYAISKNLYGENSISTLSKLLNIAANDYKMENYHRSDSINLLLLDRFREIFSDYHQFTVTTLFNLANSYLAQKRFDEAIVFQKQCLEADKAIFGEKHSYVASDYYAIGLSYLGLEQYEKAEENLKTALNIYQENFGEKHLYIARAYGNLARVYKETGESRLSVENLEKAIRIGVELVGKDHSTVQRLLETAEELEMDYEKLLENNS